MVREAVPDETQLATFDVLLDGIEGLFLRYLHLRIRPAGDLDNHVQDAPALVSEERDVVKRRDDAAILLDVNAVFCEKFVGLYCWTETSGRYAPRVLAAPTMRGVYSVESNVSNVVATIKRKRYDGTWWVYAGRRDGVRFGPTVEELGSCVSRRR